MNLAHAFTFTRIFVGPIFLLIYLTYPYFNIPAVWLPYILLFLLVISELSDAFDGYIARKFNQVTDLGKILDPMADSIYRISVFLTFTQAPVNLPIWLIFVFMYRDMLVSTLRTICALKGFALAARMSGKLKAVIQAIAAACVIVLLIPYFNGNITQAELTSWSTWIVGFAAIYTFFSGIDYIYANRSYIAKTLSS